jgi:endonuclease YncB( thermonuclease family)
MKMKKLFLLATYTYLIFFITPAYPQIFKVQVIDVLDGDTIVIEYKRKKIKVELSGIDAPEICQSFGKQSKKVLTRLVINKIIRLESNGYYINGRVYGKILIKRSDINLHFVARGLAWASFNTVDQDYLNAENNAKINSLNLWEEENPLPPWVFRVSHGSCKAGSRGNDGSGNGGATGNYSCGSKTLCDEMSSCDEAKFYLQSCGLSRLDRDEDGIPCETICR